MLPITLAVWGSTSQTRPSVPSGLGLGSSTYSQPDSGLTQFAIAMFEGRDSVVCGGAFVWPAGAPAWAGPAAKPGATETQRRQIKNGRRFAFIFAPGTPGLDL